MKASQDFSSRNKQTKIFRLAASVLTTAALAGSINAVSASPIRKTTTQHIASTSIQLQQTKPTIAQSPNVNNNLQLAQISPWGLIPVVLVGGLVIFFPLFFGGLVVIGEREVGIVVKKFAISGRGLPAGRLIALDGEAGLQADTLAPGWHWGYWPWQYSIKKESVVVVPQGEIALLVAEDGKPIPPERILGKIIECDNFQDARKFLTNGGEKGRQMGFLTAGTYRINTALFKVITVANATKQGMSPEYLRLYHVASDKVGIVTTLDGLPIPGGEIAGPIIPGHDNFQNGQRFIDGGGRRGLQEQILLSGCWNLNPWFVQVEQVPMTEIPIGYVGVVISFVGKAHEDVSGAAFTHGNLVNSGHKGVWVEPLYPGKHPINTRVMKIELVPTTNIVLNWSGRTERHNYDAKLGSLTVRSRDGFAFDLEVAQIIHVGALDAPKVISRVGAMQNLVDHVLEPTIGNYFRNSAQDYTVLDFLSARSERQAEAAEYIKMALRAYDVQAIDTLIGDIQPPATLMQTQTDRKIAEEQRKTFEVQQQAQTQRQQLVRETALADIQQDMVKSEQGVMIAELKAKADIQQEAVRSEQGVKIAELKASAKVKEMTGEAEAIRLRANAEAESLRLKSIAEAEAIRATGNAKAEAYRSGVEALGTQGYTAMQMMQIIGDRHVRLIPDVLVGGNNSSTNGLVDGLLSMILWNQTTKPGEVILPSQSQPTINEPETTASNGNQSPVVVEFPLDGNVS
ncbi:flotillin family protein [Chlorogloeopsis sp. ULAP01]|uniref:SPFH domain-containing protein n=1 Tax=Chlorogloeopsis sp. ULAP01 TaxID=3056483 RepID=UPI0025AAD79E|nr:flotillin family protein [Chlorogloeopsis sp. ULAP01]MDM9384961.1 flotillin family protein [Chlorogloeopsis sp. ULAP01]